MINVKIEIQDIKLMVAQYLRENYGMNDVDPDFDFEEFTLDKEGVEITISSLD